MRTDNNNVPLDDIAVINYQVLSPVINFTNDV